MILFHSLMMMIRNIVLSRKRNKVPWDLDGIPIEFYKVFFCNHDLEESLFPSAGKIH